MNTEINKIAAGILQRNFDLQAEIVEQPPEKWRMALIDKIDYLIANDYEKLLQVLYRIDVDESKAKKSLIEASDKNPSEVLADLIIERLLEKAKSRINNPVPPQTGDLLE
jgi:hypothetical protein